MVKTWCNSKELKRESRNTRYFEKAITQSFSQKYDIDKQKQVFLKKHFLKVNFSSAIRQIVFFQKHTHLWLLLNSFYSEVVVK